MNKRETLKLIPGQKIIFGGSTWTRDFDGRREVGVVRGVTPRGGVRVECSDGLKWVPYHHVVRVASAADLEPARR